MQQKSILIPAGVVLLALAAFVGYQATHQPAADTHAIKSTPVTTQVATKPQSTPPATPTPITVPATGNIADVATQIQQEALIDSPSDITSATPSTTDDTSLSNADQAANISSNDF